MKMIVLILITTTLMILIINIMKDLDTFVKSFDEKNNKIEIENLLIGK